MISANKFIASCLAVSLLIAAPGSGCYQVLAQTLTDSAGAPDVPSISPLTGIRNQTLESRLEFVSSPIPPQTKLSTLGGLAVSRSISIAQPILFQSAGPQEASGRFNKFSPILGARAWLAPTLSRLQDKIFPKAASLSIPPMRIGELMDGSRAAGSLSMDLDVPVGIGQARTYKLHAALPAVRKEKISFGRFSFNISDFSRSRTSHRNEQGIVKTSELVLLLGVLLIGVWVALAPASSVLSAISHFIVYSLLWSGLFAWAKPYVARKFATRAGKTPENPNPSNQDGKSILSMMPALVIASTLSFVCLYPDQALSLAISLINRPGELALILLGGVGAFLLARRALTRGGFAPAALVAFYSLTTLAAFIARRPILAGLITLASKWSDLTVLGLAGSAGAVLGAGLGVLAKHVSGLKLNRPAWVTIVGTIIGLLLGLAGGSYLVLHTTVHTTAVAVPKIALEALLVGLLGANPSALQFKKSSEAPLLALPQSFNGFGAGWDKSFPMLNIVLGIHDRGFPFDQILSDPYYRHSLNELVEKRARFHDFGDAGAPNSPTIKITVVDMPELIVSPDQFALAWAGETGYDHLIVNYPLVKHPEYRGLIRANLLLPDPSGRPVTGTDSVQLLFGTQHLSIASKLVESGIVPSKAYHAAYRSLPPADQAAHKKIAQETLERISAFRKRLINPVTFTVAAAGLSLGAAILLLGATYFLSPAVTITLLIALGLALSVPVLLGEAIPAVIEGMLHSDSTFKWLEPAYLWATKWLSDMFPTNAGWLHPGKIPRNSNTHFPKAA